MVNGSIIRGLSVCLVLAHAGWQSSAAQAQDTPANPSAQAGEQENSPLTPLLPVEERLSSEDIEAFLANPVAWLAANPNGGAELAAAVAAMAGSDPRTIDALVALASNPNVRPLQKAAIGAALARVAAAASASNPALSSYIVGQMRSAAAPEAKTSFDLVLGGSDALSLNPSPPSGNGSDTEQSSSSGFGAGSGSVGNGGGGGGGGGTSSGGGGSTSGTSGTTATVATEGGSSTVGSPGTSGNGNSNPVNVASPAG